MSPWDLVSGLAQVVAGGVLLATGNPAGGALVASGGAYLVHCRRKRKRRQEVARALVDGARR